MSRNREAVSTLLYSPLSYLLQMNDFRRSTSSKREMQGKVPGHLLLVSAVLALSAFLNLSRLKSKGQGVRQPLLRRHRQGYAHQLAQRRS